MGGKDKEKEDYNSEESGKCREDGGGSPNDMLPDALKQKQENEK